MTLTVVGLQTAGSLMRHERKCKIFQDHWNVIAQFVLQQVTLKA